MKLTKAISAVLLMIITGVDLPAQAKKPAAPPPPPVDEGPPAMSVPASYKYERRGRRDPFVNPVPKPVKAEAEVPVQRPPGLKGVLVSEATIAGIVWSKEASMKRVVIAAPGGKTYFAQMGESLFDAVVKEIQRDGVVFEVKAKDGQGRNTSREVTRKILPTP